MALDRTAILSIAASVAIVGAGAAAYFALAPGQGDCGGASVAGSGIGGPLELSMSAGGRFAGFDGPTLVYFGYTFCPDFCPTDAAVMGQAADILSETGEAVDLVFVTIDPERDDDAVIAGFVGAMHPEMIGLRGDAEEIAAAAQTFRVYYQKAGDDPEYYLMDHSTLTYLVGADGAVVDFFRHGDQPEAIAARVACQIDRGAV